MGSSAISIKVKRTHRIWIYSLFLMIWGSGLTFYILKSWFQVEGEFGFQKHPWQFTALQVHGFAAFVMMVTYGYFLGVHVQTAWKVRPLRIFGVLLTVIPLVLMVSAYLLYYIAEDRVREITANIHFFTGLTLPFILIAHVVRNRLQKKRNRAFRKGKQ